MHDVDPWLNAAGPSREEGEKEYEKREEEEEDDEDEEDEDCYAPADAEEDLPGDDTISDW
jgi:hypothetical protein